LLEIYRKAGQQAYQRQQIPAFQAWLLARNPYVGGMKELELEDLYTGIARSQILTPPHPLPALEALAFALRIHSRRETLVTQEHVDLWGSGTFKYLKRRKMA